MPVTLTRKAATCVWGSMLVVPLAFMGVAFESRVTPAPELTAPLFWMALAVSALNVALSRLLPPRLGQAPSDPSAVAFTRLVMAWALCEAAALAPLVAFILTRDPRLLGVLCVDLLALALLYPSDSRWESATPEDPARREPRRMER